MPLEINWDALSQIMTNLLKNALEACGEGDRVQVVAYSGVYRGGMPGYLLSVQDSGPGLPATVLAHLTEEKVSTKAEGQGLGLRLVYQLVEELGAAIDYRPGAAGGAQFDLFLPADRHAEALNSTS